jgi:RHS repeat-associated protein
VTQSKRDQRLPEDTTVLKKNLSAIALLPFLFAVARPAAAQDKSAASVVQLPSPGGTVTREEGTFTLNNNTGSANFRLPLPELPQRGRFGPAINLSYNQFAGDTGGGLGVGWGFTVPSIAVNDDLGTAIPGTRPEGGFVSGLSYMGARLVFLGVDGDVWRYRPEYSEQFVEIVYHPRPFETVSLGRTGEEVRTTVPSGFEVRQADGSRQIFSGAPAVAEGNFSAAVPHVTRWPLVMQLNADRDAIVYDYEKHGGRSYLTRISFAGGRSVHQLELIETQSTLHTYATGVLQENARLYGKLTSRFDDSVYAQWCFGYIGRSKQNNTTFEARAHPDCAQVARHTLEPLIDANSVTVLDQLRVLYRYGDTGGRPLAESTERFPDITFNYSSWTAAELASRDLAFEATNMAFAGDIPPWHFELADLNMDALVDIVRTTDDSAVVLAGDGEPSTAFATSMPLTLSRPTGAGIQRAVSPRLADDRFHFADIFGDSYVDIVEIEPGLMHVFDGKADGSFPYLGRSIPLPAISPTTFADGNARFQDLNMDGQSDLITTRLSADGRTEWQIFFNLTRRQPDGGHLVSFGALAKAFPFASQDGQILGRRNVRLTDVNGDRLPDFIVLRPADRGFCFYENQGNILSRNTADLLFGDARRNDPICGAGRFARIAGMQVTENVDTMWYVDANGDGIMDFASMGSRTDQLRVWLGFGDGTFLSTPLDLALNLRVQVGTTVRGFRSRVADLDADGQSEIVVFQQPAGADVRPVVVIDFNRTGGTQLVKANLLTTVDFASGRRHDIRYATSIDEMVRDRANGLTPRKLHFPVVLAKQMVTSEGVPGQVRRDVQTEEFFYHDPFYDVINSRFIGFERVDKVVYGDEFAQGGRVTQKSAIAREKYYTFAEVTADLHLAGKLKVRMTYEVLPDPALLGSAAATNELDPGRVALHSLSTATRRQALPKAGRLLRCEDAVWRAVPRGDGTSYIRKTVEHLTSSAGDDQQQSSDDVVCLNPAKTVTYDEFDEFNLHGTETVAVRALPAPLGLTVPGFSRTTQTDYDESRAALAPLGIVNAVSERRVLTGTRTLSRERFTYLPEHGGHLGRRALEVFSGLRDVDVPAALVSLHNATHTLTKSMSYDGFGNIVSMSDHFGEVEAVSFDDTGTLPLSHTRFSGRGAAFDQVTRMSYDGPRAGVLSRQVTPLGVTVHFDYDSLGRKISERADDNAEQFFAYRFGSGDRPSLILMMKRRYPSQAETPPGESEWIEQLSAYNARGNQIAEIENVAEGGVRVFNFALYNRNGKETFRWTPFSRTTFQGEADLDVRKVFNMGVIPRPEHEIGNAYTYDAVGRMVRQTHPAGKESQLLYEPWGTRRVTTFGDQFAGRTVSEEWRLSNENGMAALVISDGQGNNHVARFVRDSFGYLTEIWLPGESEPRRLTYNSIGDIEHQSIPGMGEYFYFFDARGRQSAKARVATGGERRLLTFTYDFLNRKLTESEDGELRVEFTYDQAVPIDSAAAFSAPIARPLNETTQVRTVDPNGLFDAVQRFGYDRNGRMVQNEVEIGGKRYAESFHHTLDGRIDRSTGPRGLSAKFALGPDRNLRSVTIEHEDFTAPEKVIENIAYNAEGRIRRIDYRAGASTDMTYDPETLFLTRIVSQAAGLPLQDLAMTFNENGSITEIVDALAAGQPGRGHVNRSGRFRYDFKNQLISFERYGVTSEFAYAPAGTFTRNDELESGATLAGPATAPTRLLPAGTAAKRYAFDGFGQIVSSPTLRGTVFDAQGRLIRAQTANHEVFFGYDQTGRRLYKRIVPIGDPAAAQLYLFPLESFEVGPRGEESFVHIGSTRLVRMEHGTGRWFYYLKDHLDSSDYVISSAGVPVEQMLYRAYGTEHLPEQLNPAWGQHVADIAGEMPREKTHHRFTGKYLDDETGLYYYGARYYDPSLGRFISPDPLYVADPERCTTNPIACNLFAYANNNPLAFIDPTGLDGVVAGDEAYRRSVEESLQRIDPTARVDKETGEISQSWLHGLWLDIVDFFVPGSGFDAGRDLVSRMVESEQTTTIQFAAGDAAAGPVDPTIDFTTTPGDAVINYDPAFTPPLDEFDPSTGTVTAVVPDPGIVLGHEMIHATHIMAGQISGVSPVAYTGLDGSVRMAMDEEARTVGVGGTSRPDDITENNLREMIGLNPRNHY